MFRKLICLALLFGAVSCSQENGSPDAKLPVEKEEPQVAAVPEADPPPPLAPSWTAEYEQMIAVLDLSDEQKANLQAAFEAREKALSQWQAEKGAKLVQFEGEMKEAARSRDLAGVRQAKAKAEILRDELRELTATHQSRIHEALFPEYRLKWESHQLAEKILEIMEPLNLSGQQIDRIRDAATSALRRSADEPNPTAAAYLQLEQIVELGVLTPEQRQIFRELKKRNPLRSLE